MRNSFVGSLIGLALVAGSCAPQPESSVYSTSNLIAWCVVPYDTVKRNATDRAAMLKELGFTKFAWDWRSEHIDLLSEEIEALKQADIELSAVWFWIDERASVSFQDHQLDDFPRLLDVMMPYLWTINLNGMRADGPKILDIGRGDREADMMRMVAESGFKGTIGILGHAENEDVKETLSRNLNGLRTFLSTM